MWLIYIIPIAIYVHCNVFNYITGPQRLIFEVKELSHIVIQYISQSQAVTKQPNKDNSSSI